MSIQMDDKYVITITGFHQDRHGLSTLCRGPSRRLRKRQVRIVMQVWTRSYAGCGDHGV